tara:strand:+ start:202 stop:738 length:537 start_codon:yes stop_codon:yes gene_type:complete
MNDSSAGNTSFWLRSLKKDCAELNNTGITSIKIKFVNFLKIFSLQILLFISLGCSDFEKNKIIIKDAHLYVPLKGSNMTSGYMSIRNNTDAVLQVSGIDCSPIRAEVHETKMTLEGTMKMEKIESFFLNPGTSTIFTPGGKHVMLWGLDGYEEKQLNCNFLISNQAPIKFAFSIKYRG